MPREVLYLRFPFPSDPILMPFCSIGLNVGPVIAGVVGAQKPLYDIWSNTVNVASRMDYGGEPGKIQVPLEAAVVLREQNVSCTFRATLYVKGKGYMDTYWVDLDDDLMIKNVTEEAALTEEKEKER